MAARAVGFDDYGRQSQNKGFAEAFPALLQPHHPEYQEVQALLRSNSSAYQPIWQSPIARHHQDWVSSVAFSPDGRSLASMSEDKTIKVWDVEYVINFRPNLAGCLASDWFTLDGRKLLWTNTTDNLYKSRVFEYVYVPPFSHIGILQRNLPPPELEKTLFWHSLDANDFDSAMILYEQLTSPEARESAREALIVQLTRAAQTASNDRLKALAQRRLQQARMLVKPAENNRRVLETLKELATLEQAMSK